MIAEPLSDHVSVTGRYRRSTNLEKDYTQASQNGDYILTPTARQALHRLIEGMEHASLAKAWTLTGPYGVGKSAFAVFLTRVLCALGPQGCQARALVEHCDPALATLLRKLRFFENGSKGYLPVLVTARRAPAPICIAEGLIAAAETAPEKKLKSSIIALKETLAHPDGGPTLDTRRIADSLSTVSHAARSVGYSGVLLILDELGKLFEYAARNPQNGDVFVLQELAERASRSKDQPILFVGLLHQSFQEYGTHLDHATRREWAKIQGRFEDIAFVEPAEQGIRLIAQAIRWNNTSKAVTEYSNALCEIASSAKLAPPSIHRDDFLTIARSAFPLHPATLVALPFIFRRFAQNERSLFSYLTSLEPFGFQEFIRTHSFAAKRLPTVRLENLFDYFTKNFGAGLFRQPHALHCMEAVDLLDRADSLSLLHRAIVKTIGMLNALGEFCHLHATETIISVAIADTCEPTVELQQALAFLRERSILTFRKYNRTYRIWEGSDVDIEQRIAEGERKVRQHLDLARSVTTYLSARPLVARRHSFETGALRHFSVQYLDNPEALDIECPTVESDGHVLVCLSESPVTAQCFRKSALATRDRSDILFAIPQYLGELRSVVAELASLKWAWDNTPELRDDRVARREVSTRIAEVEQLLRRNLEGLLDPRAEPLGRGCLWIHRGKLARASSPADVAKLLSEACDRIYPKSPRIRNELIVRRTLSSAAAAARRNLVERMMTRQSEENLGIEGYPPERSMYDSVLRATGLHRLDRDDQWRFLPPEGSDPTNLVFAWIALREAVFEKQPAPIPLPVLFSIISASPFGVMPGLHPVLLCAFLLAYPDETTLYREGTFLPEPAMADFEVLMRRPELYSLAGSQVNGGRAAVVERLAKGLGTRSATVPVARAMFRMMKALPEFAWNTRKLPAPVLAVREAFQNAKSPEKFLYVSLPEALGLPSFSNATPRTSLQIEHFFESLNTSLHLLSRAADSAIETARDLLLQACGYEAGPLQWSELRKSAIELESAVSDPKLLTFLRRLTQSATDLAGVESVIALIANRPPRNWSDTDLERFPETAGAVGKSFLLAARSARAVTNPRTRWELLSTTERRQAEQALDGFHTLIRTNLNTISPSGLRAALSRLLEEINE